MNKYGEAFKELEDYIIEDLIDNGCLSLNHFNLEFETLKELVDRASPIEPSNVIIFKSGEGRSGDCKCGARVFDDQKFCESCGQALDWKEEIQT